MGKMYNNMSFNEILIDGFCELGLEINEKVLESFTIYKELVKEWNEKINLTSILDDSEFALKHFIDSVVIISKFKKNSSVIDIGTGAGFPGIPLKICRNDLKITLLESLQKRSKFLNFVIEELSLKGIDVIAKRAEDPAKESNYREKYDYATARAVANMAVLSEYCLPYVKVGGYFIALKGSVIEEELKSAKNSIKILGGEIEEIKEIILPFSEYKRNIIYIKKVRQTSTKYPRKAGFVVKNPLG